MANGLDIVLNDPEVKACFVNVFGGITACDAVANGILQAMELLTAKGVELYQADRGPDRRQQRRRRPAHPERGQPP